MYYASFTFMGVLVVDGVLKCNFATLRDAAITMNSIKNRNHAVTHF